MNDQPDKIFRDKLEGWQVTVSASAREHVFQNTNRGPERIRWMKFAAAVVVVAAASFLLTPRTSVNTPPLADAQQYIAPGPAPETRDAVADLPASARRDSLLEKLPKRTLKKSKESPAPVGPTRFQQAVAEVNTVASDSAAPSDTAVPRSTPVSEKRRVTLVFTAAEVDQKYLRKDPETEPSTDSERVLTSPGLLDKVYAVKHNQTPMGSLRQKKNEILALNFKNENPHHEHQ